MTRLWKVEDWWRIEARILFVWCVDNKVDWISGARWIGMLLSCSHIAPTVIQEKQLPQRQEKEQQSFEAARFLFYLNRSHFWKLLNNAGKTLLRSNYETTMFELVINSVTFKPLSQTEQGSNFTVHIFMSFSESKFRCRHESLMWYYLVLLHKTQGINIAYWQRGGETAA